MKLKLCIHVPDSSLYIKCVLYCCCPCAFVAIATLSFDWLIMGKVEIDIYFCVTADILTKVLLKCSWSSPLPTIWILSKSLILIGGHGNWKANFSKYSKIFLEAIRGMKLKLHINVYDISLYINCVFLIAVAHVFSLLWQLKVSIDLKWEKWK